MQQRSLESSPRMVRHGSAAVACAMLLAGAGNAVAQSDRDDAQNERSNYAFGITGGTLGVGGELALKLHPNFVIRGTGSTFSFPSISFDNGDTFTHPLYASGRIVKQDVTLTPTVVSAGLLLDMHLFRDGGRVTGGFRYLDFEGQGKISHGEAATLTPPGSTTSYKAIKVGDNVYGSVRS